MKREYGSINDINHDSNDNGHSNAGNNKSDLILVLYYIYKCRLYAKRNKATKEVLYYPSAKSLTASNALGKVSLKYFSWSSIVSRSTVNSVIPSFSFNE